MPLLSELRRPFVAHTTLSRPEARQTPGTRIITRASKGAEQVEENHEVRCVIRLAI